jgi:hypothetical protein
MKKIFLVACLLFISLGVFSQGFFKPVSKDLFALKAGETTPTSVWLFRPSVELTAMQFTLTKPVQVESLTSLGAGVSYQHFVEVDGLPYNNFGVNALLLFNQDIGGVEPSSLGVAITVNALQYVNVGAGYSFGVKKFCILTGIVIHFN